MKADKLTGLKRILFFLYFSSVHLTIDGLADTANANACLIYFLFFFPYKQNPDFIFRAAFCLAEKYISQRPL